MKRKFTITLFLLSTLMLLVSPMIYGQQPEKRIILRGRVLDAASQLPLSGASVIEVDKDGRTINGTVTDIDGNYALRLDNPKENNIAVAYINYKTFTEKIKDRPSIDILLENNESSLTDVIVKADNMIDNGTGLKTSERTSTLATATIDRKDLENLSTPNIAQALQGRLPGVDVSVTSGDPGAGLAIRIRGTATINGSATPLIVLDGMPYSTTIPADFNFGTADVQGYAQLLNVAPADIQDITVLKDAAATAVWGSKAANGVLIINTKRGKTGKPAIAYSFQGTFSKQPNSIPLLNGDQFATLVPEEVSNTGKSPLDITSNKEFSYDPTDPYWYHNYSNNTNWIDAITQTGYSQEHNVSMTGGG
ncbi:MAG TPA: TonB-dependent receptor plug domain-containing protein, partial [Arachidicoccus sp.]|nr:TonB-dependent receptor plug domain-containing protein [Arachidicoccus sp.]